MPPIMLNLLPQSNFWLKNILLPFTVCQRFFPSMTSSPGYCMPAEWTPHQRTLMAWPDRISVDTDTQLHEAWTEVANIAETIAKYEPVWLYVSRANKRLANDWVSGDITIKEAEVEQLWVRDTGPLLVHDQHGQVAALGLNFGYWGSKLSFPNRFDITIASRVARQQQLNYRKAPFVSEGGALETDGEGTLLVTESSILNNNRNSHVSKAELERHFHSLLGITKVIWLPGAKGIEITDTHIDLLARFAPNDTILLSRPNEAVPSHDIAWRIYAEAKEVLESSTNAAGRSLRLVEVEEALTVPSARRWDSGERLATSYVNFYTPNGAVVVPRFGDERTDVAAEEVMKKAWPQREVVGVTLDILPWMGGGVHCATLHWPIEIVKEKSAETEL